MRRFLVLVVILVFVFPLQAQIPFNWSVVNCTLFGKQISQSTKIKPEFKFEITQEITKKQAEITITGKSFDEVWKATTRTLISIKYRISESDKEGGTIFAQKRPNIFYEDGDVVTAWNIMIEGDEEEIVIFCVYNVGGDNPFSKGKKAFRKFHQKLKERLSN